MATRKKDYYDPLDSSGNNYEDLAGMSELHKAAIEGAKNSWAQARERGDQEGMDAAHAQAEAIRALYGYSGGGDGSQYLPSGERGFSYESAPEYTSKYRDQIDALTRQLLGRGPFSYDYREDESYRQYEDQYTRSGQMAMKDTLGQISARTGGLASSYAGSAAQQTYNGYMAELAGIIPELRQAAYEMYMADYDRDLANIGALQDLEEIDYSRYLQEMDQWNEDRNMAWQAYQDAQAAEQWQQQQEYAAEQDRLAWEYQRERDAVEDSRYEAAAAETEYEPELTYSQTLDAIERGVRSEKVLNAYQYFMGEPYEAEETEEPMKEPQELSAAAQEIVTAYQHVNPGTAGNVGAYFADRIEKAWTSGQITEAEAEYLLTMLGV